jgi:hypothetical protein
MGRYRNTFCASELIDHYLVVVNDTLRLDDRIMERGVGGAGGLDAKGPKVLVVILHHEGQILDIEVITGEFGEFVVFGLIFLVHRLRQHDSERIRDLGHLVIQLGVVVDHLLAEGLHVVAACLLGCELAELHFGDATFGRFAEEHLVRHDLADIS